MYVRLPKRRRRPKAGLREPSRVVCPQHLQWIRGNCCILADVRNHVCWGKIEAHHVTTRGAGGGDETAIPVCSAAHRLVHDLGRMTFERRFGKDLAAIASGLAALSPALRKYRMKQERG